MGFYKELGDRLEKWLKEKIKVVDTKVESITKYQKYVNTELDYCYLKCTSKLNLAKYLDEINIPFDSINAINGIIYNESNNSILLKAGKTYQIIADALLTTGGAVGGIIYDSTNDKNLGGFHEIAANANVGYGDITGICIVTPETDCEIQLKITASMDNITISTVSLIVQEIGREVVIDPVEYVNTTQGIEDSPVGHIISHMGTVAPKHYLICDGTEYNIIDYPYLAQHILDNFGSVNYFGGDGTTTFAVPDLRGEFLRGTGTNSYENQGSGATVGEHQNATTLNIFNINADGNIIGMVPNNNISDVGRNEDSLIGESKDGRWLPQSWSTDSNWKTKEFYTVRPTNTSVLYCIKYEPTYFMNVYNTNYMQPTIYSEEEKVVGSWLNGKPLYEKVVKVTMPNKTIGTSTPHGIENLDTLTNFSLNWYDSEDKAWYDRFRMWISSSLNYSISNELNIDSKNINITPNGNNIIDWSSRTTNAFCKLQYTKTTDEENSFTADMIKDSFIELTYTDEEIYNEVASILNSESNKGE